MSVFAPHLERWSLRVDGAPIATRSSHLLPVRRERAALMLKIAHAAEERRGAAVMAWWAGDGAARVLAHEREALLLERATGATSLMDLAASGRDDDATRIICATVARLHAPRSTRRPTLTDLDTRFRALRAAGSVEGQLLARAARTAAELLRAPRDVVVLHGDIHHGNILDFGERGWLAIDPKGLFGERGFDYANLFCNPDLVAPEPPVAVMPERFRGRVAIVAEVADLEPRRLLRWILAGSGLSASWSIVDGGSPEVALTVSRLAAAALDG